MRKAAATVSFLIAGALLLTLAVSFGCSVNRAYDRLSPESAEKANQDAANGIVTEGDDDPGLNNTTLMVCGLGGGAFLIAGFALWPKDAVSISKPEGEAE